MTLEIDGKHYHNTADQDGKWQIQVGDALSDGKHDYKLTVADAAGNHTEQRGLLTVDTQKTPSGKGPCNGCYPIRYGEYA